MFAKLLIRNPKVLNFINFLLKKIIKSKYAPKIIKNLCLNLTVKLINYIMPHLFGAVASHVTKSKSKQAITLLEKGLGYKVADYLSDTKKIAINVQLEQEPLMCKTGKCVLDLRGEGCGPFETIYCETCGANICSLKVPYMTEAFHKKYIGLKD